MYPPKSGPLLVGPAEELAVELLRLVGVGAEQIDPARCAEGREVTTWHEVSFGDAWVQVKVGLL